jgi:hypothetical protein
MARIFYTYLWLREDGTPYYAGKGSLKRAFSKQHRFPPPREKDCVLLQAFPNEDTAFAAEKFLISFYGRKDLGAGCLRNFTDGGEGASGRSHRGWRHTAEARNKIRESLRGNKRPLGKVQSVETRRKKSLANKGKPWSGARRKAHKGVWSSARRERFLHKKMENT